ncbi:MAG: ABC transporter ATP-binding protein [Oscillospiraceae bacterium]|nr:ABC transporter ATP-binding protein [Oscillospiraceae bacterium]
MVEVKHISYAYQNGRGKVLENVSFSLEPRQCLAILGNNGAGKSTLLKCIDRILPTKGASVTVDGKEAFAMSNREMAQQVAFVPQHTAALHMTVFDAVLLGRKPYIKWDATREDRRIAAQTIRQMGLENDSLRNVSELSGGEAQKVMLARALAQQPRLLLLDEPTSDLDPRNQHEVMQTVRKIAQEHDICVMTVLHDLNLAIRYCDRFLFLKDAGVYACGGREVMTPENIEAVYEMHVHLETYMGIPVIIPFPDV